MATKIVTASKEEIAPIAVKYLKDLQVRMFVDLSQIEQELKGKMIDAMPDEIYEILKPLAFGKNRVANFGLSFKNIFGYSEKVCLSFQIVKLSNDLSELNSHPQISVIGLEDD